MKSKDTSSGIWIQYLLQLGVSFSILITVPVRQGSAIFVCYLVVKVIKRTFSFMIVIIGYVR
jgi:hypothetical protein